jgi:hypothetical protein
MHHGALARANEGEEQWRVVEDVAKLAADREDYRSASSLTEVLGAPDRTRTCNLPPI